MTKAIVYSSSECVYCDKAISLLLDKGIRTKVISDWDVSELKSICKDGPLTVPQIFLDNNYIGGYSDLKKHLREK